MYNNDKFKLNKNNFYKTLMPLSALAALLIFMTGCQTSKELTLYTPILPGTITGTVKTYDGSAVTDAIVFLASDALLESKISRQKVKADGKFSFLEVKPGYYYLGAYIDKKNDGTYTIGEDYLGGKLADQWDLENTYHPQVLENKDTSVNIGLLAPMPVTAIDYSTSSVNLNPAFNWPKYPGASFYRLRVISRSKSFWVIDTARNSITYGSSPGSGEVLITPPTQLIENEEYFWSVTAFKSAGVPIAYSDISRFFTAIMNSNNK